VKSGEPRDTHPADIVDWKFGPLGGHCPGDQNVDQIQVAEGAVAVFNSSIADFADITNNNDNNNVVNWSVGGNSYYQIKKTLRADSTNGIGAPRGRPRAHGLGEDDGGEGDNCEGIGEIAEDLTDNHRLERRIYFLADGDSHPKDRQHLERPGG